MPILTIAIICMTSLVDANSPTMLPHHTLVDCHTTERSQEGWKVDRRPGWPDRLDGIVTFDKVAVIQTPAHVRAKW